MIDKEMAEEYAIENRESCMYNDTKGWETDHEAIKKAFLAGLEAGKDMAETDLATTERYKRSGIDFLLVILQKKINSIL